MIIGPVGCRFLPQHERIEIPTSELGFSQTSRQTTRTQIEQQACLATRRSQTSSNDAQMRRLAHLSGTALVRTGHSMRLGAQTHSYDGHAIGRESFVFENEPRVAEIHVTKHGAKMNQTHETQGTSRVVETYQVGVCVVLAY